MAHTIGNHAGSPMMVGDPPRILVVGKEFEKNKVEHQGSDNAVLRGCIGPISGP